VISGSGEWVVKSERAECINSLSKLKTQKFD